MFEFFMLMDTLGVSGRVLMGVLWTIGVSSLTIVAIVRRQQILPALPRLIELSRIPNVRECLIFAPICAICGVIIYYAVIPFCFSSGDIREFKEGPPPTAEMWVIGYLSGYGAAILGPLMVVCSNKPNLPFGQRMLLPLLGYMSCPPLGFYSIFILLLSADISAMWFFLLPVFHWLLCLIPFHLLRWGEVTG